MGADFDIFAFSQLPEVGGNIALIFGTFLSSKYSWFRQYLVPRDKFSNFLMDIGANYKQDIPYHNQIHGVDVLHTMMHFCASPLFERNMTDLDLLSAFIAAICHDVGHTGQTNQYHINAETELALRYNDRSVLENFHISLAFKILKEANNSFLENLSKSEYKYVRDSVIDMVLGTDMFFHQRQLQKLQQFTNIIAKERKEKEKEIELHVLSKDKIPRFGRILNEKRFVMTITLHLSDVSSPAKKLSASMEWTMRITQEFFDQGDKERAQGLPISAGCDRNSNKGAANIAKQTLAFIYFIVHPMFKLYHILDPDTTKKFLAGIKKTRAYWEKEMKK